MNIFKVPNRVINFFILIYSNTRTILYLNLYNIIYTYEYIESITLKQGCLCLKHYVLNICLKHSFKRMFKRSLFKTYYVLNIV